jgi:hypothetical protein
MEPPKELEADPATEEAKATGRALLAEWQRQIDAWPWWRRLWWRYPYSWWRDLTLAIKAPVYDEEELRQSPALAEMQREWDALPRRQKLRQYQLPALADLGVRFAGAWLVLGAVVFVVGGLIIKFLVPGGSEWLRSHTDTFALICLAPAIAWLFGLLLWAVLGWVALPFLLARGLWRWLRG